MTVQPAPILPIGSVSPLLTAEQLVALAEAAPAAAIEIYRRWLALHPERPDAWIAWFNLAVLLEAAGQPQGALGAAATALRQKPDLRQAALAAGQAAEAQGDRTQALAFLRQVLPPAEGGASSTASSAGCSRPRAGSRRPPRSCGPRSSSIPASPRWSSISSMPARRWRPGPRPGWRFPA